MSGEGLQTVRDLQWGDGQSEREQFRRGDAAGTKRKRENPKGGSQEEGTIEILKERVRAFALPPHKTTNRAEPGPVSLFQANDPDA